MSRIPTTPNGASIGGINGASNGVVNGVVNGAMNWRRPNLRAAGRP